MEESMTEAPKSSADKALCKKITEGQAIIQTQGNVFYNPVQEFNRDIRYVRCSIKYFINFLCTCCSITILNAFARQYLKDDLGDSQAGLKCEKGLYILEALSATGLRSIRYAKEISGVKEIIANDISIRAVDDIKRNIHDNNVEHLVTPSNDDAVYYTFLETRDLIVIFICF